MQFTLIIIIGRFRNQCIQSWKFITLNKNYTFPYIMLPATHTVSMRGSEQPVIINIVIITDSIKLRKANI